MLGADISDPNTSDLNGPGNEATLHYITVLSVLTVKSVLTALTTELNHQPSQFSICTAQVVCLNFSVGRMFFNLVFVFMFHYQLSDHRDLTNQPRGVTSFT